MSRRNWSCETTEASWNSRGIGLRQRALVLGRLSGCITRGATRLRTENRLNDHPLSVLTVHDSFINRQWSIRLIYHAFCVYTSFLVVKWKRVRSKSFKCEWKLRNILDKFKGLSREKNKESKFRSLGVALLIVASLSSSRPCHSPRH